MKRINLVPAAVLAVSMAIAGCASSGSSDKSTAPAGGGSSTKPSTSAPASASAAPLPTSTATYPAGTGSITVGSADFTENVILADIYADALTAKGVKVTKKLNIGERAQYIPALKDGSIDFIPEYTGSVLVNVFDTKATAKTPADVYTALEAAVPSTQAVLNPSPAQDSDTITVTKATAAKDKLKTIGDLAPVASGMTLGAPQAFKTRADGVPSLKSVYGVTFGTFTPLQAGGAITVTALKNGTIDAADIFSTDPSIAANGFVSLTDDKSMFAAQNVVPLVTKSKITQTIADAANAVSAKLDTAALGTLVGKVSNDKQDPDVVAKAWLASVGLG